MTITGRQPGAEPQVTEEMSGDQCRSIRCVRSRSAAADASFSPSSRIARDRSTPM